jgi:type II secretory pathway component PulK
MLKNSSGDLDRTRVDQLLLLLDLLNRQNHNYNIYSYAVVPAIIDWTDPDDQVTILPFITGDNIGAESNYYGYIQPAVTCKNQSLDAIQELLLVKGFDNQLFSDLKDHITIYGSGKININYADSLVLQSISLHITADLAQAIIERRDLKPFTSLSELLELPGMNSTMYAVAEQYLTTKPQDYYYTIAVRGTINHIDSFITAVVKNNTSTGKVEIISYRESNQTG